MMDRVDLSFMPSTESSGVSLVYMTDDGSPMDVTAWLKQDMWFLGGRAFRERLCQLTPLGDDVRYEPSPSGGQKPGPPRSRHS
jgi:hypothetical protein